MTQKNVSDDADYLIDLSQGLGYVFESCFKFTTCTYRDQLRVDLRPNAYSLAQFRCQLCFVSHSEQMTLTMMM